MRKLLLILIKAYRYFVSPLLGLHCRFTPSCSCYMEEAVQQFGFTKGFWLGLKRLSRCHPFCAGGYDPIPVQIQISDKK